MVATARIAYNHARVVQSHSPGGNHIHLYQLRDSFGPRELPFPQTASRSVQPFCRSQPCDKHTDRQTDTHAHTDHANSRHTE